MALLIMFGSTSEQRPNKPLHQHVLVLSCWFVPFLWVCCICTLQTACLQNSTKLCIYDSCLENPINSMERPKDRTLKDELPRSVGAQYATGDQWRTNFRKNEETEPKQKQHPVVDFTGDRSKVWSCKEQYCIETWNVRSMNQGKLKVVK